VLGVFAGSLVDDSLLLAITVGVVGGIALGYLADRLLTRLGLEETRLPPPDEILEAHERHNGPKAKKG
jgi:hypothetical protein